MQREILNAEIAEMLLTDAGAEVTLVENGKLAVDCFLDPDLCHDGECLYG